MWVEKYRPKNPSTMVGNEDVRLRFMRWLSSWGGKSRPALLIGPPGVGKTTLVHAAAAALGYEVLELNASDARTKGKLEEKLNPSLLNTTLTGEKMLIFLDEVDGIYGRQDHGGLEFIRDLMGKSRVPLVMAANVEDDEKVEKLARKSELFRFRRVPPRLLEVAVKSILSREELTIDPMVLRRIVSQANGDIRAALNSAQAAVLGRGEETLDVRDVQLSVTEALKLFFDADSLREAYMAIAGCRAEPREKIQAIFQSIVGSGLEGEGLVKALEELSKADELAAEIARTQNYRLLRYFDSMLAASLYNALKGRGVRYGEYTLPWSLQLRVWNEGRQLRELRLRVARLHHVSSRDAVALYLPYLIFIMSRVKGYEERVVERLRLDEGKLKVLMKEASRL